MPPVQTERRHHQLRNFYSYEDRRLKPSIYPEASCCPACGCAVVQNGEYCRDCKEPMELEKEIGLMPFW